MMPVDRLLQDFRVHPPGPIAMDDKVPKAAVSLVFRGGDLLFIRRAEREGDPWSGHMAFPGGRQEAHDPDLLGTATRETMEELSLDLAQAIHLGRLSHLVTPRVPRKLLIAGHVFTMDDHPPLVPNHEVANIHWFSFERLMSGEGRDRFEYKGYDLEVIRLDGVEIWGLTLWLLDQLMARVKRGGVSP